MDIAFHIGAFQTQGDSLLRCLQRNVEALTAQGIVVPAPGRYRPLLRELVLAARGAPDPAAVGTMLLDTILDRDAVRRVVLSHETYLALPRWAVGERQLYPSAGERVALLRRLFPQARLHLFLGIRSPATFLPALAAADPGGETARFLDGLDPGPLRWSRTIAMIRDAAPEARLTVWNDEDVPLLWPEILRAFSGHAPDTVLDGWLAWYWDLVTPKAHAAMRRWFQAHPGLDDAARRRSLSAMLARMARPEANELPDLPAGWSDETLAALTAAHEADLDVIGAMPGVTLMEP